MPSQEELRDFWLHAPEGKLCGREQAKAWALREVWLAEEKPLYGMYPFIASKLKKNLQGAARRGQKATYLEWGWGEEGLHGK